MCIRDSLIESDAELERIKEDCKSGKLLCGQCKRIAADLMENFLKDHQERREQVEDELNNYTIIW